MVYGPSQHGGRRMDAHPLAPQHFRDLVSAVVALNPYRRALTPMIDEVARVAFANDQIRACLQRIGERSQFLSNRRVTKSDLGDDRATLFMFLEHVRFASPAFLASVGEARSGEVRA